MKIFPREGCKDCAKKVLVVLFGDRQTPSSRQPVIDLFDKLIPLLLEGKNIGIHYRQGIGRSSLLATCFLIQAGVSVKDAFARIEEARGRTVPDTPEQMEWVKKLVRWKIRDKND